MSTCPACGPTSTTSATRTTATRASPSPLRTAWRSAAAYDRAGQPGFDVSERVKPGRERVQRRLPGGIPGVELGAEVGRGEALDRGDALGVLVGGLGHVIAG